MKIKHARKGLTVKMSASELERIYRALIGCVDERGDRIVQTIEFFRADEIDELHMRENHG